MKRFVLFLLVSSQVCVSFAQTSPYKFSTVKENARGAVEDQCATGTCWSFATMSFLESEVMRKSGLAIDLSEMYNVRMVYPRKAESYVRFQGKQQFGPGGLSHDVIQVVREKGMVPELAYPGLSGNSRSYDHGTLDGMLESLVKSVLDKKLNEKNQDWKKSVESILNAQLGETPREFEFMGKRYTPIMFRDAMGINPDDYVGLTSFTHQEYYSPLLIEVPDNWAHASYVNLPMAELVQVMDYALENGFTVAWDGDVSERSFSFNDGVAIMPSDTVKSDHLFKRAVPEITFDPLLRQEMYESFETADDHLMHITGIARDQNGNRYYITKNSWGVDNPFFGYLYLSVPYFEYKTIGIYLHKDAIPASVRKKAGI